MHYSLSDTSPVDKSKFVHGRLGEVQRLLKPPVSFSTSFPSSLTAVPYKKNHDTNLIYSFVSHHSSDFENKFVCGEIMSYEDLREYGSEASVKAAGKLRQQGKPYESTSFFLPFLAPYKSLTYPIFILVVDGDIAYWKAGA